MVFVNGDGTLLRCFNAATGASTPATCGFTARRGSPNTSGFYSIDFGFQVNTRFFSTAVINLNGAVTINLETDTTFTGSPNKILVLTRNAPDGVGTDRPFSITVY
jgi:hypothetical protein